MDDDLQRQAAEAAVEALGAIVAGFAPHTLEDEARLRGLCSAVLMQQEAIGVVISDACDPAVRKQYPFWGFTLRNVGGRVEQAAGKVSVPKTFQELRSLDEVLHYATIVALVTSPAARAILAAHGYDIEFGQRADTPPEDKLVLVKN